MRPSRATRTLHIACILLVVLLTQAAPASAESRADLSGYGQGPGFPVGPNRPVVEHPPNIYAGLAGQLVPKGLTHTQSALKSPLHLHFVALVGGLLSIGWYAYEPELRRTILIASGHSSFSRAGGGTIVLTITGSGRRLLTRASAVNVTATGVFTPRGSSPVRASRTFQLTRYTSYHPTVSTGHHEATGIGASGAVA